MANKLELTRQDTAGAATPGGFGNAARLFNEVPPPEEAPTETSKQLEVAMLWGDTIIDVRHLGEDGRVTVGGDAGSDFSLFSPAIGASFALASVAGGECELRTPAGAVVALRRGGQQKTHQQLVADGVLRGGGGESPSTLTMQLHDCAQVTVDNVAFIVRWVKPQGRLAASGGFDFYFTKVLTTSMMAGLVLLAAIFMTDINAETLSEDLFRNPQRFAKLVIKPPEKEPKKKLELKKKEEEQPKKVEERFGQVQKDQPRGPNINAGKRETDKKKVMSAGLLAVLGGGDGSVANVFAPGGMGTGINQALGSLKDSGISDSHGVGGLGSRGTGPGGGGGGLGLGGLGTKGGGRGSVGGYGSINLAGRGKGETRIVPGKTTVTGSCERTVIGQVIAKRANEIRYCYEVELNKDPNLAGKVAVTFTIDPTGAVSDANIGQSTVNSPGVENCILTRIKRWKFPEPKGGGVCIINYPWVFKAAGSDVAEAD